MTKQDLLFGRSPITSGFGDYMHSRTRGAGFYPMSDISYEDPDAQPIDYEQMEYERNKSALARTAGALGAVGGALSTLTGNVAGVPIALLGANMAVKNTPGAPKGYNAWDYSKDFLTSLLNNRDETNIRSEQGKQAYEINPQLEQLTFEKDYVTKLLNTEEQLEVFRNEPTTENNAAYQQSKQEVDRLTPQYVQSVSSRIAEENSGVMNKLGGPTGDPTQNFLTQPASKQLEDIDKKLSEIESQSKASQNEVNSLYNSIWDRELGNNWLLNHKVSEFYQNKEEKSDFSFTDLDSWMFKVPGVLGSSFASIDVQVGGIAAAYAMNLARTAALQYASAATMVPQVAAGGQLLAQGFALAGTAATIWSTLYAREREAFAELFEHYSQKVQADAKNYGVNLEQLLEEGKAQLASTIDVSKLTDEEVLNTIIASNVPTSDDTFNQIRSESRKNLDHLYNQNMALAVSDIAQVAVAIPFVGKMMAGVVKGGTQAAKLTKLSGALNRGLDNAIEYGAKVAPVLKTVAKSPNLKAFGKHIGKNVLAGTAFTMVSEAYEEGNQYIGGKRYLDNMYNGRSSNVLHGIWDNMTSSYEASKAILGIGESVFADDEELFQNMIAGGMIGGLMNLPMRGPSSIRDFNDQVKTNKYVRSLTAEQLKEKENMAKIKMYANHTMLGKQDALIESLNGLKDNLPEGLTVEDINEEITRAQRVMDIANSAFVTKAAADLGIEKSSEQFQNLVAMADYTLEKFESEQATAQSLNTAYNVIYESEHFKNIAETLTTNPRAKEAIKIIAKYNTEQYALRELLDTLRDSKTNIDTFNERFGTKLNSAKIQEYIKKLEQQEVAQNNARVKLESFLKDADANFTMDDIESYASPYGTLMDPVAGYQKLLLSGLSLGDAYEAASIFNGVHHPLTGYEYDTTTGTVNEKRAETPYNKLKKSDKAYVQNFIKDYLDKYERVEQTTRTMSTSMAEVFTEEEPVIKNVPDGVAIPDKPVIADSQEQQPPVGTQQPQQPQEPPVQTGATTEELPETPAKTTEKEEPADNTINDEELPSLSDLLKATKTGQVDSLPAQGEAVEADISQEPNLYRVPPAVQSRGTEEQLSIANTLQSVSEQNSSELNDEIQRGTIPPETFTGMSNTPHYGKTAHTMFYSHTDDRPMTDSVDTWVPIELRPRTIVTKRGTLVYTTIVKRITPDGITAAYESHTDRYPERPQRPTLSVSKFAELYGISISNLYEQVFGESNQEYTENYTQVRVVKETMRNPGEVTVDFDLLGDAGDNVLYDARVLVKNPVLSADYTIRSGKELGEVMGDPSKTNDFDYEIIVGNYRGKYNPLDMSTLDNASIYLHVTDRTNGNKYMAAMKEPDAARAIHENAGTRTEADIEADVNALRLFRNRIISLYQTAEESGTRLIPTAVHKTNGLFNTNVDLSNNVIQRPIAEVKGFEIPDDIYAIDKGTVALGIGKGVRGEFAITDEKGNVMGGLGRSGKIYLYPNSTPSGETVNIQLNERTFENEPEVVDLIFDLLIKMGNNQVDRVQTLVNGVSRSTGFTPYSLLKMIINNGPHTLLSPEEKSKLFFLVKKQLNFDQKTQKVQIGDMFYTRDELLSDMDKQAEFKDSLRRNFHWTIDKQWLWEKIGNTLEDLQVFFQNSEQEKLVLVPGKIEFTREDAGMMWDGKEVVHDPSHEGGISWISWYARNGVLQSDLKDQLFVGPFLYIDDVKHESAEVAPVEEKAMLTPEQDLESLLKSTRTGEVADINDLKDQFPNEEDPTDNPDWDAFFGAERAVNYQNTTDTIDTVSATKWLNDKLGIPSEEVYITKNVITLGYSGTQAMGLMRDDAILLWEGAERGTEYHEAYHRVSLLLQSPAERARIYTAYRQRFPNQILTDKQVEEALAEDFRDWVLSKTRQFKYRIQKFFNKILNFIGATRLLTNTDITDLYSKIVSGHFKGVEINEESLTHFKEVYSNGTPFQLGSSDNPVTFKYIPTLTDFYNVINSLQAQLFFVSDVRTTNDLSKLNVGKLKQFLAGAVRSSKFTTQQKLALVEVYNNFDDIFWPELKQSLENLGVRYIDAQNDANMTAIESGEVNSGEIQWYDRSSFEISKKDNALFTVKTFIAQIVETKFEYYGDSKVPQNKKVVDPLTGLPRFVDFDTAWNTMLNNLHDIETYDDFINRIAQLSTVNPFFATLHNKFANNNRLPNNLKITTELKTQLLQTMKSHKPNMYFIAYGNVEDDGVMKLSFRVGDSESVKATRIYPTLWSENFYNRTDIVTNGIVDNKKLAKVISDYNALATQVSAQIANKQMTPVALQQSKQKLLGLLSQVGVNIDIDVLNTAMLNMEDIIGVDQYRAFANMLNNRRAKSIFNLFNGTLDDVSKGKSATYKVKKKDIVKPLDKIFTKEGFVTALAEAYNAVHPRPDELTVLGADGNLLYPISQNNYLSDTVRKLNRATSATQRHSELAEKMSKVTYNKRSRILSNLHAGNKIALNAFVSFVEESSGDRGRKYTGISPLEDYVAKLTLTANDHIVLPTLADRSTYYTITGVKLNHEPLTIHSENGANTLFIGDKTLRQLLDYANDEWDTIKEYYSPRYQQILAENPEKKVKNYHTKNFGGRFRHFTGIWLNVNGVNEYTDFNELLDKFEKQGNINGALEIIEREFFAKEPYFKLGAINELVKRQVLNEVNTAVELGLVTAKEGVNSRIPILRNKLLDQVRLTEKINKYKAAEESAFKNKAETYAILDMLTDFTANTIVSIIEFEKVFSKDPAYYNGVDDKIKRLSGLTSTGDNLRTSWEPTDDLVGRTSYTVAELRDNYMSSPQSAELEKLFTEAYLTQFLNDDQNEDTKKMLTALAKQKAAADVSAYRNDNINETDATVYISPRMYTDILKMLGEWDSTIAEAFAIMESGTEWLSDPVKYSNAIKTLIKPLKMTSFNDIFDTDLHLDIPIYDKMALFPMFKILATGDNLELYNRMTSQGKYANYGHIDMVKMSSAVKVGSRGVGQFYTNSKNDAISDLRTLPIYSQEFDNLRRQLSTDPHLGELQMLGTQVAKAAVSNLRLENEYGNETAGYPKRKGFEIRDEVFGAMNALSNLGAQAFLNQIGEVVDGVFQEDLNKLSALLQNDAKTTGLPYDTIEGLQVVNGDFRTPLSASSNSKWLESRFISLVNKNTVDINTPGGSFIQMTAFATRSITTVGDEALNKGKRLNFINSDGSMDAMVSINLFKHIIPAKYQKTHKIARQWLIDNGIIGTNAKPAALGYRIPTQGLSSISALKIVDVLPEVVADTVVLPSEFTTLTGSDFDVDKLFIARYNYEITESGARIVQFNDDPTSEETWEAIAKRIREVGLDEDYITKEYINWIGNNKGKTKWELNSREANENRLLDMYMTVLTDLSKINETRSSVDKLTSHLKGDVLLNIEGSDNIRKAEPFAYVSPTMQSDKKYEYTVGKRGIGPFALNNVNHVLTQLIQLRFKQSKVLKNFNLTSLSGIFSRDTERVRILDWLSALINAHVDIAKDPYIVRMNVVQWTYNMVNFLIRTGVGENTFYFVSQPILKDMAKKISNISGRFGVDQTRSASILESDAIEEIRDRYYERATALATPEQLKELQNLFVTNPDGTLDVDNNYVLWSKKYLLAQLKAGRNEVKDFDYYYNQLLIHRAYEQLEPYAKGMSELVHASQVDTKKTGNNFMLQKSFLYRVKDIIVNSGIFHAKDIRNYFKNTFLDTKLRNSTIFTQSLFKDKLIRANDQFASQHNAILALTDQLNTRDEVLLNQVSNALEAKIKTGFFTNYIEDNSISVYHMLFGDKSMANRLIDIKSQILSGKYPEMLDANGHINNEFLNYIDPKIGSPTYDGYAAPDFITTNTLNFNDKYLQNKLKRYWQELLNSEHEDIRKFAEDLAIFAFITSGDNPTMHNIFSLLPLDYREKLGYNNYIRETMDQMNHGLLPFDVDDVFKNNWFNGKLVPDIKFRRYYFGFDGWNQDTLEHVMSTEVLPGTNQRYPLVIFNKRGRSVGHNKDKKMLFPPYVKYNIDGTKDPATTILYKHVANHEAGDKTVPVYTAVHKKGLNVNGVVVTEYDGYSNSALGFNNLPGNKEVKLTSDPDVIEALLNKASFVFNAEKDQIRRKLLKLDFITDFNLVDIANSTTYDSIMNSDISAQPDVEENENTETDIVTSSDNDTEVNIAENLEPSNETILFHSRTKGLEALSNFYGSSFTYEDIEYPTAEHAFQAQKSTDNLIKWGFSTEVNLTPEQAESAGSRIAMRQDWESVKDQIMFDILKAKFEQNQGAREQLLSTGNAELIHNTGDRMVFKQDDAYWGNGFNGNGLNMMGRILMAVRSELQSEMNETSDTTDQNNNDFSDEAMNNCKN